MTIRWPVGVLRPQNVAFDIAPRSLAGPASVSGKTQVVSSDAGIWKATFGNLVIRDRDAVLAHRALSALLEGRLGTILIPLCRGYQPVPAGAEDAGLYDPVPHGDGTPFGDDSEYHGGVIDVTAAADAPVRAVSMTVTVDVAGDIQSGQHFSIGERLYRVRSFATDTGILTFRPPLRELVPAGARLEFDDPVCRMRLASDDAMDLELSLRRFGSPTVNFIEDV
jgi:hypothetical protein